MTTKPIVLSAVESPFSARWRLRCEELGLPYRLVNCYGSDVIGEVRGARAFLWQWMNGRPADLIAARRIIEAADFLAVPIFPNRNTCWFYDDKLAQKYLLEAIGADLVPTYVFYDLGEALSWIESASYPKVFKLSRGAGSANVRLIRSGEEAARIARQAFHRGFKPARGAFGDFATKVKKHRRRGDFLNVFLRLPGTLMNLRRFNRYVGRDVGYLYLQDFVPGNDCDTRVTVIGDRAFAYRRLVRPGDFRASGSGELRYDHQEGDVECVRRAFGVAERLGAQSLAFDFVKGEDGAPRIIEISYCYVPEFVFHCPGHWDRSLNWVEGNVWPQDAILDDLLAAGL